MNSDFAFHCQRRWFVFIYFACWKWSNITTDYRRSVACTLGWKFWLTMWRIRCKESWAKSEIVSDTECFLCKLIRALLRVFFQEIQADGITSEKWPAKYANNWLCIIQTARHRDSLSHSLLRICDRMRPISKWCTWFTIMVISNWSFGKKMQRVIYVLLTFAYSLAIYWSNQRFIHIN